MHVPLSHQTILSNALKIRTVSVDSDDVSFDKEKFGAFEDFILFLHDSFPTFHQTCNLTRINCFGLLYSWEPKKSENELLPMLLTAHIDVVPVEKGTESEWKYPAYDGCIEEDMIWGRGALDIKSQVISHMIAVEELIKEGFCPKRTFYFAYGFDEEIFGNNGARKIVEYLCEKNIRLEGVLDEGGCVITDVIKGVKPPIGVIGVGEKGYCDYVLTVGESKGGGDSGGHSSMPPRHTALGQAGRLLCAMENNPMPARLTKPLEVMLMNAAGEMGFIPRLAVANLFVFRPLLLFILGRTPTTNALVRTTMAPTIARAGDAPNVLPNLVELNVNVRLLPGNTVDEVERHIRALAARVCVPLASVRRVNPHEASPISPHDTPVFRRIKEVVGEMIPEAICTPYLVMGGTDAKYYTSVCDNVYRFCPYLLSNDEKNTVHNTNEAISVENFGRMIFFFKRFISRFDS